MKPRFADLRWDKAKRVWFFGFRGAAAYGYGPNKTAAEKRARATARRMWEKLGFPVQLRIWTKAQRIGKGGRNEASYGCDSKRRKG